MTSVRDNICKFFAAKQFPLIIKILITYGVCSATPAASSQPSSTDGTQTFLMGCDFQIDADGSTQYSLKHTVESAEWGMPTEPLTINMDDETTYETFFESLRTSHADVIDHAIYDDTNMFIKFFREFKSQNKQDLASFYKGYKYSYDPKFAQPAYETYLFKNMVNATGNEALKNHFYMISVHSGDDENFLKDIHGEPRHSTRTHSAGAVKINLYSKITKRSRPGLIIFDLTLDLAKEKGGIVLMDDGQDPHYDKSTQYNGYRVHFEYVNSQRSQRQYVVSNVYSTDGQSIISKNLYYVEKPYCSILDSSLKPLLLTPIHGMMARRKNDFRDSMINFLTLPLAELKNETVHSFYIEYKTSSGEIKHTAIPFQDTELQNFDRDASVLLQNVCKGLGMDVYDFMDRMGTIQRLVMKDEKLLTQIFELNKKLRFITDKTEYNTGLMSRFPTTLGNGRVILPSGDDE